MSLFYAENERRQDEQLRGEVLAEIARGQVQQEEQERALSPAAILFLVQPDAIASIPMPPDRVAREHTRDADRCFQMLEEIACKLAELGFHAAASSYFNAAMAWRAIL